MNTLPLISIPTHELKAISMLAPHDDVRYYLNGVLVQANANGVMLVATNGHYLGILRISAEWDGPNTQVIIPISAIENLKALKSLSSYDLDLNANTIRDLNGTHAFTPIDGKFPDFERVVPATVSGEPAQYNADYLGLFGRVYQTLHQKKRTDPPYVTILHNGTDTAVLNLHYDWSLFLLMPMRDDFDCSAYLAPEWVRTAPPQPIAKAA